jgi:4-amino-4-deoxy-L-arabinose transferase-like glycosyltransferase
VFTVVTTGLVVFVVVALFLFLARRVFRLAVKLALVGVLVILLVCLSVFGWWRGWFGTSSSTQRPVPQSNQRPNSNRRPSPR